MLRVVVGIVRFNKGRTMNEIKIPIAEIFESPQGEGAFAGTLMTFIRLAGCTVGRAFTEAERSSGMFGILQPYQEKCTAWDNAKFACDTDYRAALKLTLQDLAAEPLIANAKRICLTGGEPLMHRDEVLIPLLQLFANAKKTVHIETSGTISVRQLFSRVDAVQILDRHLSTWIAISPKKGVLDDNLWFADEIKILVGSQFDENVFVAKFGGCFGSGRVWLQPINNENALDMENVERCLALQRKYKDLRLSLQMHKVLGVR